MSVIKMYTLLQKYRKIATIVMLVTIILSTITADYAYANSEKRHVEDLRERIIETTETIAFPLGGALIFLSVVLIAIKIIVSHYNPSARGQALEGLQWVAVGSIILGSAILIANILISMGGGELEKNIID